VALLSDFLDRDLPPDTCGMVQAHLDSCAICGKTAESLRRVIGMCRDFRHPGRPAPVAPEKRDELKKALQNVLSQMDPP
jgi:anti-sigma factor RsiW